MSGGGGSSGPAEVKETQAEQTQAEMAINMWNNYQQRFAPLEDRLAYDIQTRPADQAAMSGKTRAATAQQFSPVRDKLQGRLMQHGLNPASPGFQERSFDLGRNEALSGGLNAAHANQQLSDNEAYGRLGISQLGRGETATGLQMAGSAAQSAQTQAEMDARNALQQSMADNQLTGALLGAGTAAVTGGLNTGSQTQSFDAFSQPFATGQSAGGLSEGAKLGSFLNYDFS